MEVEGGKRPVMRCFFYNAPIVRGYLLDAEAAVVEFLFDAGWSVFGWSVHSERRENENPRFPNFELLLPLHHRHSRTAQTIKL